MILDLVAAIVIAARAAALKAVAMELAEIFERADVAAFAADWFAGDASRATVRRELAAELDALARLALAHGADDADDLRRARRMAVAVAIGSLQTIVLSGHRYGRVRGDNRARFDDRREYLRRAHEALRAA